MRAAETFESKWPVTVDATTPAARARLEYVFTEMP
jgi:hypothetical protein